MARRKIQIILLVLALGLVLGSYVFVNIHHFTAKASAQTPASSPVGISPQDAEESNSSLGLDQAFLRILVSAAKEMIPGSAR